MVAVPVKPPELATTWRFSPIDRAGKGATSEVWRALDRETGLTVALKVGTTAESARIFADEAERQALATSPLIPELVDVGWLPTALGADTDGRLLQVPEGERRPYLASTWIDGRTLDAVAPDAPSLRHSLALAVARDIGSALADLHVAGVAHGDVKPSNILLETLAPPANAPTACRWRAYLVDLGLAVQADERQVRGATPRYLPPELWDGSADADPRARDRFALGLVLAEILASRATVGRGARPARTQRTSSRPFRPPLCRAAVGRSRSTTARELDRCARQRGARCG